MYYICTIYTPIYIPTSLRLPFASIRKSVFLSPLRERQDERLEKSALGLTAPFGRYHISRDFAVRFTFSSICVLDIRTYVGADKNGRTSWGGGRKVESVRKGKTYERSGKNK